MLQNNSFKDHRRLSSKCKDSVCHENLHSASNVTQCASKLCPAYSNQSITLDTQLNLNKLASEGDSPEKVSIKGVEFSHRLPLL